MGREVGRYYTCIYMLLKYWHLLMESNQLSSAFSPVTRTSFHPLVSLAQFVTCLRQYMHSLLISDISIIPFTSQRIRGNDICIILQ